MKKRKYIEDSLFYRLFNFLYAGVKLNIYFSMLNLVLFLLCMFSSLRADTFFIFFLSFVTVGPSLLALLKTFADGKYESITFLEFFQLFKGFFLKGLVYSFLIGFLMLWFVSFLSFLLYQPYALLLLPLFVTFGVSALATIVLAMQLLVEDEQKSMKERFHISFQLSWRKLFLSYFIAILITALIFVMYYRAIYGFLVLFSLVFYYVFKINERMYLVSEENKK